jgi:uncharacterized protein (TIGR02569 family)
VTASSPPPAEVLEAFGADGAPEQLAGGSGKSWRVGDLVLKPGCDAPQVEWVATAVEAVADTADFRMSRHARAREGQWVVDGWAATGWLDGDHGSDRWDDVLTTSRAFHAALSTVARPDGGIPGPETWWETGMRVAWGEAGLRADAPEPVRAMLEQLTPHLSKEWSGPSQVIHSDIANNVLFAADQPPGVIDMSPNWRPAEFANAIAVADAMAWQGAPLTLAIRFAATVDGGDQLLARAVAFRVVTATEVWPAYPERVAAEVDAFRPVLTAIRP